jgi:hypothetical protein
MALKGGHVSDFDGSLAAAIERALADEWQTVKGQALPSDGRDDRRLLFVAIAQGVLRYLKAHENDLLSSITLDQGGGPVANAVSALGLEVTG